MRDHKYLSNIKRLTPEDRADIAAYVDDSIKSHMRVTPWYDARGWDAVPVGLVVFGGVSVALVIAYAIPVIIAQWQEVL